MNAEEDSVNLPDSDPVYDHAKNRHSEVGPRVALPLLLDSNLPVSLLDVGCGTGTWLKAALDAGVRDVLGIDGIELPDAQFLVSKSAFRKVNLAAKWRLQRRFDVLICLEVAEHLPLESAAALVESLTAHSDRIFFSAACPGQEGDHHLNCQWPDYWQGIFNTYSFRCDDLARWQIWDESDVEPWYRQNVFSACRDPGRAGAEPRIKRVLHPAMFAGSVMPSTTRIRSDVVAQIEEGSQPVGWYFGIPARGLVGKVRRLRKDE